MPVRTACSLQPGGTISSPRVLRAVTASEPKYFELSLSKLPRVSLLSLFCSCVSSPRHGTLGLSELQLDLQNSCCLRDQWRRDPLQEAFFCHMRRELIFSAICGDSGLPLTSKQSKAEARTPVSECPCFTHVPKLVSLPLVVFASLLLQVSTEPLAQRLQLEVRSYQMKL